MSLGTVRPGHGVTLNAHIDVMGKSHEEPGMRIGELSARTGASRRMLRYYEQQGLLVSTRSPSGQRYYDEAHVERVALIQTFLAAGMSSRSIARLAPCMSDPSTDRARLALTVMDAERTRLTSAIDNLTAARAALDHLMEVNRSFLSDER
jgi:DNA-binding transcriptional MerR regulator